MKSQKEIVTFRLTKEELKLIDKYKDNNCINSRSNTIRILLSKALRKEVEKEYDD